MKVAEKPKSFDLTLQLAVIFDLINRSERGPAVRPTAQPAKKVPNPSAERRRWVAGHWKRVPMCDLIRKLTPEQALEVLMRLTDKGGAIRDAVLAEAGNLLSEIDLDEIADEVFLVLDSIDVQHCWDRAGSSRDGYTSPDEAAAELIDEQLQPFFDQAGRYHELGMTEEEATYCSGVILGVYRYEHESKSEFRQ